MLAGALLLGSCAGESGDAGGTAEVVIRSFRFQPDPLVVPAGTAVTFINEDATVHTVTAGTRDAPTGAFDHELAQGESVTITFAEAGDVDYFCTLHAGPGMEATIVVE